MDSKDGQGDSGIWQDSIDGKEKDNDEDDSSSSDSDGGEEANHFLILDPSQNANMTVNEISGNYILFPIRYYESNFLSM